MNLEGHPDDIIRQARAMSGVSLARAAQAANLTETELSVLEDSGKLSKRLGFTAQAGAIGLNGAKLESIPNWWLPSGKDLNVWRELRVFTTDGDGMTYLIGNWQEDAPHVAMVGDAIFAGSMGRGNDSWELARTKVREHILTLPAETLLSPGHDPLTTVAEEIAHNPFY